MSLPRLFIWGASGHARVIADAVLLDRAFELMGFLDDVNPGREGELLDGYRIYTKTSALDEFRDLDVTHALIGIGKNSVRSRLADRAESAGFILGISVHPRAVLARSLDLGRGTVVMAGAILNPGVRVGRCCVINTGAILDHECVIGDGASIAPGATLAGNVRVGKGAWVGAGATIKEKIEIGANSLIGAGAVVVENIPPGMVAYGVPARIIREVTSDV